MSSLPPSSDPRLTALAVEPYSANELDERLDRILDPVLSTRRTATPIAQEASSLPRSEQDFILHWTAVIAITNAELAYQFACAVPTVLRQHDHATVESWIIYAMDTYDREGLHRGTAVLKDLDEFAASMESGSNAQDFEGTARVLELFLHGLSGRQLRLDTAAQPYTDTETIYLPPRIARLPHRDDNFLVYKAMAALLWAQSRYGTFNVDLKPALAQYPSAKRALDLFSYLETVRLHARIATSLPGLARDMHRLQPSSPELDPRVKRLCRPDARASDSLAVLMEIYENFDPPRTAFGVELRWDQAMAVREARLSREKSQFQAGLTELLRQQNADTTQKNREAGSRVAVSAPDSADVLDCTLTVDGQTWPTPNDLRQLVESIRQDLGEIPDDYFLSGSNGEYREREGLLEGPDEHRAGTDYDAPFFFYNEWDCDRRHYRKNWCVLRELDGHPGDPEFARSTLVKYAVQVTQLKRTFEMMRGEERLLKQQSDGSDIDYDALVSAYTDMRNGMELPERLFVKRHRTERDLAVMFMVDMSGSTKGWINDAEREALVMLCEALEVLGDRYAIYGFSGITRKRCEIYRIKRFEEPYDRSVQSRISGIRPQDYTRMGAAIRHLSARFSEVDAKTKLLITLSDGKPDDYSDNYRGRYGIEDTRQALVESHRTGIKPFCITIDREARDYLPHLYGPVNWTLVNDVARLPLKISDIYRRLTR